MLLRMRSRSPVDPAPIHVLIPADTTGGFASLRYRLSSENFFLLLCGYICRFAFAFFMLSAFICCLRRVFFVFAAFLSAAALLSLSLVTQSYA